jgi:hypothetical protein
MATDHNRPASSLVQLQCPWRHDCFSKKASTADETASGVLMLATKGGANSCKKKLNYKSSHQAHLHIKLNIGTIAKKGGGNYLTQPNRYGQDPSLPAQDLDLIKQDSTIAVAYQKMQS